MDRAATEKVLIKLAERTAASWRSLRGEAFRGDTTLETANTIYRFKDGVFSGRAPKPPHGAMPEWESPPAMKDAVLIGFLADESGLWSLSPKWRPGALAVIVAANDRYTTTSTVLSCTVDRPEPTLRMTPAGSDVFAVFGSRPPTVRRPAPPSMTRLQTAPSR